MTKPRYELLSRELLEEIEAEDRDRQSEWIFLSPSEEFKGRWEVDGIYPEWFFDFEDLVGQYKTISPARLNEFLDLAEELDYKVVFDEPPETILRAYDHLKDDPPFKLNSSLENTVNGLLPWQIQGFNKLVKDESLKAGMAIWDTGAGKTAFMTSALLWHEQFGHPYDLAMVVVKKNNKLDTKKKLLSLGGVESIIIDGPPLKRDVIYEDIETKLLKGEKVIAITNYDKFLDDHLFFKMIIKNRNVLFFWDEMPTKLSNTTKGYEEVKRCLWDKWETRAEGLAGAKPRANWMRQWALTATPVESNPEGVFRYLRLMNPVLLGRPDEFRTTYVTYKNEHGKSEKFRNLDKLEAIIEHMMHRVSRADPEVAKMFPHVMEDVITIDWHPKDRTIYDMLVNKASKLLESETEDVGTSILAIIQVMQMLCDAPSMVVESAKNRMEFEKMLTELGEEDDIPNPDGPIGSEIALMLISFLKSKPTNDHHTKLETLREILLEKHPDDKVLVYMTWASYGFGPITEKLDEWGVSYVAYTGTDKQRQTAKDTFRSDPSIRVFLSSDKGSDSIDLPEAAVGINYNLPWSWTRKRQRQGRNDRVDSKLEHIWWYDLIMANSIEERKREIIDTKRGYHEALFDGNAAEESISSKLTQEDLLYILLGD